MMNVTRQFYIPSGAQRIETIEGMEVYRYNDVTNRLCAVCFVGRVIRPTWRFGFESENKLATYINKTADKVIAKRKYKGELSALRKARKAEAVQKISVGDIFVEQYDYESTIISFWQVISKHGAKLELKMINKTLVHVDSSGRNEDYMPDIDSFVDNKIMARSIKTICADRVYLVGTSTWYSVASWNGKPVYQTNAYWR